MEMVRAKATAGPSTLFASLRSLRMTGLFSGCLFSAANYDSCTGGDHGAGIGGLLAGCAVADDLDFEAGGSGLFDDLADGQAEERWDTQTRGLGKSDGLDCLLRGSWLSGSLQRGCACLRVAGRPCCGLCGPGACACACGLIGGLRCGLACGCGLGRRGAQWIVAGQIVGGVVERLNVALHPARRRLR